MTGKQNFTRNMISMLPVRKDKFFKRIAYRALLLNCTGPLYEKLWEKYDYSNDDNWATNHFLCNNRCFMRSDKYYDMQPLSDFERRQLTLEIDVLCAMQAGMTLEQLIDWYSLCFPVLKKAEESTWYDGNGRIVTTDNRTFKSDYTLDRSFFGDVDKEKAVEIKVDNEYESTSIFFEPPYVYSDRIDMYKEVWNNFSNTSKK